MKIVINRCYGGFGLSDAARLEMGIDKTVYHGDLKRNDKRLIAAVEKLGDAASDELAQLKVVEIPDGIEYTIEEYDGIEWVAEKHRVWGNEEAGC